MVTCDFFWQSTGKDGRISLKRARSIDGIHTRHNITPFVEKDKSPSISYHNDFLEKARPHVTTFEIHYKGNMYTCPINRIFALGAYYVDNKGDAQIRLKLNFWDKAGFTPPKETKETKKRKATNDENPARLFDCEKNINLVEV